MSAYRSHTFGAGELRVFLRVVDRFLIAPTRVEIIGGSAAALAHSAASTTADLDTFTVVDDAFAAAAIRASKATGLEIPVSQSTIADVPYNYEDRLERQLPELEHLEVWVLEKHDLVLSKTIRCHEHDLQQIREVYAGVGLSFDVLLERFQAEMAHVMGEPSRLLVNFLEMIEAVFGELKRVAAERALKSRR